MTLRETYCVNGKFHLCSSFGFKMTGLRRVEKSSNSCMGTVYANSLSLDLKTAVTVLCFFEVLRYTKLILRVFSTSYFPFYNNGRT